MAWIQLHWKCPTCGTMLPANPQRYKKLPVRRVRLKLNCATCRKVTQYQLTDELPPQPKPPALYNPLTDFMDAFGVRPQSKD